MSEPGRSRAFAPLRLRTLAWQLAVLVVAEIALYASYSAHDARFHWATHFLVGLTVASLWQAAFLLVAARPARLQLLQILGFHLWAMWPDLVFRAPGVAHYPWMDLAALGHISSHYVPGGDTTWLVLALATAGAYALLLARWLQARHAEMAAGMAPAVEIGGAAVLRPQHDPHDVALGHQVVGPPRERADGLPFVLLHGLGGTGACGSRSPSASPAPAARPCCRTCSASGPRCASGPSSASTTSLPPCCACSTTTASTSPTSSPTAGAAPSRLPWRTARRNGWR